MATTRDRAEASVWFYDEDGTKVPGERHTNPDGTRGGWKPRGMEVPASAYIGEQAVVLLGASVTEGDIITTGVVGPCR